MRAASLLLLALLGTLVPGDAKLLRRRAARGAVASMWRDHLQRKILRRDEPEEDKGFVGYQQQGVDEEGRLVGGGCINWEDAKLEESAKVGDGTLEECAKKCKDTDGCTEFMHCSGSECVNSDGKGKNEMNFCALAKKHCYVRPNMKHQWMTYRFLPDCDDELEKPADTGDYVCPIGELKDSLKKGYFRALHCTTIHGNSLYHGMRDKSFAERWMKYYHKELECLFSAFISDKQDGGPCGGMKSQFESRKVKWEKICLSPGKASVDVLNIMEEPEKMYWFKMKSMMKESQAFATLLDLVGDKELECNMLKLIDDECGGFQKPRMMSPGEVKRLLKPPKKTKDICRGVQFEGAEGPCGTGKESKEPHEGHP